MGHCHKIAVYRLKSIRGIVLIIKDVFTEAEHVVGCRFVETGKPFLRRFKAKGLPRLFDNPAHYQRHS
jgi:hypothetical protein